MVKLQLIEQSINQANLEEGIPFLGIKVKDNKAVATSRQVAKVFDKEHNHVLRDIRNIIEKDQKFGQSNFGQSYYKNSQNKKQPQYLMTRKGFTMLVMGFTGEKAFKFKKMYIEAFERMREIISKRIDTKEGYKEMTSEIKKQLNPDNRKGYSREADMINKAVLGMKASKFKKIHGIEDNHYTRDSLVGDKLEQLQEAQKMNAKLIKSGLSFRERKHIITKSFSGY